MFSSEYQLKILYEKYSSNRQETLIIAGSNDPIINISSLKETAKEFNYQLRSILHARHGVITDSPHVVNEIINNFI